MNIIIEQYFAGLARDKILLRDPGSQNEPLLQTKFSMEQFLPPQVKFITYTTMSNV